MPYLKNSIDPKLWGPSGWSFIHYTALGYPDNPTDEDKINYKIFYYNLPNTLPCLKCALNFKENLQNLSIDNSLNSREDLFKWTVDIHNMVNNELGKPNLSHKEAYYKYSKTDNSYSNKDICIVVGIVFLFLTILYLIKK
jgi:hypothetical protein